MQLEKEPCKVSAARTVTTSSPLLMSDTEVYRVTRPRSQGLVRLPDSPTKMFPFGSPARVLHRLPASPATHMRAQAGVLMELRSWGSHLLRILCLGSRSLGTPTAHWQMTQSTVAPYLLFLPDGLSQRGLLLLSKGLGSGSPHFPFWPQFLLSQDFA